jgi:hypothetical protein
MVNSFFMCLLPTFGYLQLRRVGGLAKGAVPIEIGTGKADQDERTRNHRFETKITF